MRKGLLAFLLLFGLGLPAVFTMVPDPVAGMTGSGTVGDPYVIYNVTDLQDMRNDVTAYYSLNNSIDATNTSSWNGGAGFIPVGNTSTPFSGFFEGNNFTITGLHIDRGGSSYQGLFGYVKSTAAGVTRYIRNVNLEDVYVDGTSYVGALIGRIANADYSTALTNISGVHVSNVTPLGTSSTST